MDLTWAELTGWGSLETAASIAVVIRTIVSGGNDACGKSFMRLVSGDDRQKPIDKFGVPIINNQKEKTFL
jgi:hypothetical protein